MNRRGKGSCRCSSSVFQGPDYDSTSETEIALEEARLNALVQHWESASITASLCSSASRSLQSTPIRYEGYGEIKWQSGGIAPHLIFRTENHQAQAFYRWRWQNSYPRHTLKIYSMPPTIKISDKDKIYSRNTFFYIFYHYAPFIN